MGADSDTVHHSPRQARRCSPQGCPANVAEIPARDSGKLKGTPTHLEQRSGQPAIGEPLRATGAEKLAEVRV